MEQLEMWGDVPHQDAAALLEEARRHWIDVRRHHAIGSTEELDAWRAYREASDRVWEIQRVRSGLGRR